MPAFIFSWPGVCCIVSVWTPQQTYLAGWPGPVECKLTLEVVWWLLSTATNWFNFLTTYKQKWQDSRILKKVSSIQIPYNDKHKTEIPGLSREKYNKNTKILQSGVISSLVVKEQRRQNMTNNLKNHKRDKYCDKSSQRM